MTKKINRFYIGASHIADAIRRGENDAHTHATLAEAITKAKARVEQGADSVVIVQIVRIVKHKDQPVVVEVVK